MSYQIKNTEAKVILTHPSLVTTAIASCESVGFSKDRLFLFSDVECKTVDGVKDWRSVLGTPKEAESWKWERMGSQQACERIAAINYSSGYTPLHFYTFVKS